MMFPQETALGQKIAKAVYGKADDVKSKNAGLFTGAGLIASGFTSPAASAFFPMRAITSGVGYTGPIFRKYSPDRYKDIIENNFPGFFQLYLSSAKAKERLSTLEIKNKTLEGEDSILFLVPAGNMNDSEAASTSETDYLQILKELSDFATAYDKDVARYTSEYNALAREINRTEADMKMNECYIPNLIPLDLQISLENTFSTVQVQTAETPTMQYFGAQDPEIQLSFETDEAGVAAVEQMLRTVGRFVKQYRDGLVTGFMSIDAPLLNMMGVRSVIPVSAQYNTIAGHPDRFAVDLVLSAFDKTQRRQEALYGYTAGNPDDTLIDRAFDNYDPAVDSLYVHEHLRQMELYPDLEMPKVSELDDIITLINSQMEKWENRTNQVFLDPDFYISTNQTYRNYLKDALDDSKGVITRWQDASGLMANSDLLKNKALDMEGFTTATGESMESRFNAEAAKLEQIDPETTWSDFGEKTNTSDSEDTTATMTTGVATPPKFTFGSMNDYMKNKEYEKAPDYALWKTWGNTGTEEKFNEWKKENITEEVSEATIWNYLADCIITSFGRAEELTYAKHEYEFLTDSKYTFTDNVSSYYYSDKTLGELSWVNGKNYYMTGYFMLGKANGNKRKLENGFAPEKDTGGNWYTTASAKGFKTMPFQRIMSYMRSIMRAESNWQQFEKGLPLFQETNADGYGVKAGIMGALLPSVRTTSDIGRLVWDWKFNMRTAIAAMAKVYHQCRDSEYNEISLRALDWAIISHSGAVLPTILTSDKEKDDKPGSFLDGDMVPERSSYYQSIETAKNTENILATNERATGIFLGRSGVIDEVYKMYNTGKEVKAGGGYTVEMPMTDAEVNTALAEERTSITLNMERWTTEEKFKGMFVDMYQHDQTGRMLRAFPSFSMQIVDEGKWFNNYRTWDNFYGFSALHSIDVYKSRKIAADTAVIKAAPRPRPTRELRTILFPPDVFLCVSPPTIVATSQLRKSREQTKRVAALDRSQLVELKAERGQTGDSLRHHVGGRPEIVAAEQHLVGRHQSHQGPEPFRAGLLRYVIIKPLELMHSAVRKAQIDRLGNPREPRYSGQPAAALRCPRARRCSRCPNSETACRCTAS